MSSSIDSGLTFVGSENKQASIHHRPHHELGISEEEGREAASNPTFSSALQGKKKTHNASKLSPPPPPARDAAVAKVQIAFSSCRCRKGANLLRLHPDPGMMRKVQFCSLACCRCRRCTTSKLPPPKAAAAAHEPMPSRDAAAIPSSKAKWCRSCATSRSRRPTGSPDGSGWRALLRIQQCRAALLKSGSSQ